MSHQHDGLWSTHRFGRATGTMSKASSSITASARRHVPQSFTSLLERFEPPWLEDICKALRKADLATWLEKQSWPPRLFVRPGTRLIVQIRPHFDLNVKPPVRSFADTMLARSAMSVLSPLCLALCDNSMYTGHAAHSWSIHWTYKMGIVRCYTQRHVFQAWPRTLQNSHRTRS
jgi:hypothetical protein